MWTDQHEQVGIFLPGPVGIAGDEQISVTGSHYFKTDGGQTGLQCLQKSLLAIGSNLRQHDPKRTAGAAGQGIGVSIEGIFNGSVIERRMADGNAATLQAGQDLDNVRIRYLGR